MASIVLAIHAWLYIYIFFSIIIIFGIILIKVFRKKYNGLSSLKDFIVIQIFITLSNEISKWYLFLYEFQDSYSKDTLDFFKMYKGAPLHYYYIKVAIIAGIVLLFLYFLANFFDRKYQKKMH